MTDDWKYSSSGNSGLKTIAIILLVVILAIVVTQNIGTQQGWYTQAQVYQFSEPEKVVDSDRSMHSISLWDDTCVWSDYRSSNWDIYMYNISDNDYSVISPSSDNQSCPDIYQDAITYQNEDDGDIYVFYLSNLTSYYIDNSTMKYPRIFDDNLTYQIQVGLNNSILHYDLAEHNESFAVPPSDLYNPVDNLYALWGENLVFSCFNGSDAHVSVFDITSGEITKIANVSGVSPVDIHDNLIVYRDGYDVVLYDLDDDTNITITTLNTISTSVAVYYPNILYSDIQGGKHNVYAYNLIDDTETLVASFTYMNDWDDTDYYGRPFDVYGDYIVILGGNDSADQDLYLVEISLGEQPVEEPSWITTELILQIVAVVSIISFVIIEGAYFKWRHLRK